jgi:hypothetical protein
MLLVELFRPSLDEEGDMVDDDIAMAVDNIVLRAKQRNDWEMNLEYAVREVAGFMGDVYIDPTDSDFRQTVIDALQANDMVQHVDPAGKVIISDPNKQPRTDAGDPGDEMKKQQKKQSEKIAKKAANNVKKDFKDKPGELSL